MVCLVSSVISWMPKPAAAHVWDLPMCVLAALPVTWIVGKALVRHIWLSLSSGGSKQVQLSGPQERATACNEVPLLTRRPPLCRHKTFIPRTSKRAASGPVPRSSYSQLKIHLHCRVEFEICRQKVLWIWQPVKERERKAWKVLHLKNHVPAVVSHEDVEEYGSVESAVSTPWMEGWWKRKRFATNWIESVWSNLMLLELIQSNLIQSDLIEFAFGQDPLALLQHQSQSIHRRKRFRHASYSEIRIIGIIGASRNNSTDSLRNN